MIDPEATWQEIPIGGLIDEPGTATEYETGDWRAERPVFQPENCTDCLICWIYCPDSSIEVKDGKMLGIDLDHCKGCGICAAVCPINQRAERTGELEDRAIEMVTEG